jgi:D-sedoheptulose 7-phosphate isomerase
MNRVDELYVSREGGVEFADGYLRYLTEVLASLDRTAIAAFAQELLDAREREARIFFLGNGGSAATASHWVNDLTRWRGRPFRAISLTENVALLTAVANDYGYEHVFRQQLENLMAPGDVVVAISASGNSPNVVEAIEYANASGAVTVGMTGFDGGRLRELAHIVVHAPTNSGEYGPAEDVHLILDHLVTSFLWQVCAAEEPRPDSPGAAPAGST